VNPRPRDVRITDSTLRDGSHAMRHRFTQEQVRAVVSSLDAAGVDVIEVSHGDVDGVLAAAEEVVRPIIPRLPWMDRSSVVQGYAGVYSSFLLHAQRAAERYGVPAHAILQRVGEAGYVGGQEDMIIDIALQLQAEGAR
jgi:isopropylmalate/homocitrate/citramalate synthase